MTWFKQDSNFWRHRKLRRIPDTTVNVSLRVAAAGVWSLSGVWSSDNLSDGFVPAEQVQEWDPTEHVAQRLVAAGLWEEAEQDGERGYQFRNWEEYQPTREQVENERAAARDRMRRIREGRSREVRPNFGGTSSEVRPKVKEPQLKANLTSTGSGELRPKFGGSSGEVRSTRSDPIRSDPSSSSYSSTHSVIAHALGLRPEEDEEEIQTIYNRILAECNPKAPARYIQTLADNGDLAAYATTAAAKFVPTRPLYTGPTHTFVKHRLYPDNPSCDADGCGFPETNARHATTAGAAA